MIALSLKVVSTERVYECVELNDLAENRLE